MTLSHTAIARLPIAVAAAALALAGCSSPDIAQRDMGNAALKGQHAADGTLQPVATRTVIVGSGGQAAPACPGTVRPRGGSLTVRWSPTDAGPPKARLGTEAQAYICQRDGEWAGIVFPAAGQGMSDCLVTRALASPRDYQGPCRWGWVKNAEVVGN